MTDRAQILRAFLEARRGRRFRPGGSDCAMFVADWIVACGHDDPGASWRGRYATLDEGRAALSRDGFAVPSDVLRPYLLEGAGWMQARTGDVVTVNENGWEAFGIVGGGHIHALQMPHGITAVPLDRAIRVYRP
ncbi:hypothetical protein [uncultured Roseovarius sp.]|uniref:DUF6950 family protein n=1 Tax=uncultured Roseovarius sp. TaxID=293344 RepID=UPI00260F67A2|nr:hypothetical protein [uncultured Roseovarius sp.]